MNQIGIEKAEQAAEHAGDEWRANAYMAVVDYAKTHHLFTIEDVRLAARLTECRELRAWGAIIRSAQKNGLVERVGWIRAKVRHVHGRAVTQWRSNLCSPPSQMPTNAS